MAKEARAVVQVRLPPQLRANLDRAADAQKTSLNTQVVDRLERSFAPQIDAAAATGAISRVMGSIVVVQEQLRVLTGLPEDARDAIANALLVLSALQALAAESLVALHPSSSGENVVPLPRRAAK